MASYIVTRLLLAVFLWILGIVSNQFFTEQITTKWLHITTVLIVTMPETAVYYKCPHSVIRLYRSNV